MIRAEPGIQRVPSLKRSVAQVNNFVASFMMTLPPHFFPFFFFFLFGYPTRLSLVKHSFSFFFIAFDFLQWFALLLFPSGSPGPCNLLLSYRTLSLPFRPPPSLGISLPILLHTTPPGTSQAENHHQHPTPGLLQLQTRFPHTHHRPEVFLHTPAATISQRRFLRRPTVSIPAPPEFPFQMETLRSGIHHFTLSAR